MFPDVLALVVVPDQACHTLTLFVELVVSLVQTVQVPSVPDAESYPMGISAPNHARSENNLLGVWIKLMNEKALLTILPH